MDNNTRWEYEEEEHDNNMRKLEEAEEVLDVYQREIQLKTGQLIDYVCSFYRELDEEIPYNVSQPFEEILADYNFSIKQKREELEELRLQEQREFYRKMDL